MPSGSKKRKAAKKKNQHHPQITSSRNEDFKTQNGTSSESREVNGTYDHHHKCPDQLYANDDKLEKKDYNACLVLSTVDEDKSLDRETIRGNKETVHELGFDDSGVVEVENELTSVKNNAEPRKKFDERDDESSSSSSVEECNNLDKRTEAYNLLYKTNVRDDKPDKYSPAAIGINESSSVGECINSLDETNLVSHSVKSEVPVSTEKICLIEVAAGEKLVEGKTFSSSVLPAVGASKDDVATKDSEIPICSKNHSLASAPILAQRASIFSCCGLFDFLRGSNY